MKKLIVLPCLFILLVSILKAQLPNKDGKIVSNNPTKEINVSNPDLPVSISNQNGEASNSITDKLNTEFIISPNPATTSISIFSKVEFNRIDIYSLSGSLLLSEIFEGNSTQKLLDLHYLPEGLYFMVISGDKVILGSKIIVIK